MCLLPRIYCTYKQIGQVPMSIIYNLGQLVTKSRDKKHWSSLPLHIFLSKHREPTLDKGRNYTYSRRRWRTFQKREGGLSQVGYTSPYTHEYSETIISVPVYIQCVSLYEVPLYMVCRFIYSVFDKLSWGENSASVLMRVDSGS